MLWPLHSLFLAFSCFAEFPIGPSCPRLTIRRRRWTNSGISHHPPWYGLCGSGKNYSTSLPACFYCALFFPLAENLGAAGWSRWSRSSSSSSSSSTSGSSSTSPARWPVHPQQQPGEGRTFLLPRWLAAAPSPSASSANLPRYYSQPATIRRSLARWVSVNSGHTLNSTQLNFILKSAQCTRLPAMCFLACAP